MRPYAYLKVYYFFYRLRYPMPIVIRLTFVTLEDTVGVGPSSANCFFTRKISFSTWLGSALARPSRSSFPSTIFNFFKTFSACVAVYHWVSSNCWVSELATQWRCNCVAQQFWGWNARSFLPWGLHIGLFTGIGEISGHVSFGPWEGDLINPVVDLFQLLLGQHLFHLYITNI